MNNVLLYQIFKKSKTSVSLHYQSLILSQNFIQLGEKALSLKINDTIKWLSLLNQKHPDLYHNISEVFLTNNDEINLVLAENPTKIMLGNENTHHKIDLLKAFEKTMGSKKEITDFAYLDMRYNNQVVVKE